MIKITKRILLILALSKSFCFACWIAAKGIFWRGSGWGLGKGGLGFGEFTSILFLFLFILNFALHFVFGLFILKPGEHLSQKSNSGHFSQFSIV